MPSSRSHGATHPRDGLFAGEKPFPVIPACEHFAGSEKLIVKALELRDRLGPVFDVTCDCEDGAEGGREKEHATMIVEVLLSDHNRHGMAGAPIHHYTHRGWEQDIDILLGKAGNLLPDVTIPKCTSAPQAREMIAYVGTGAKRNKRERLIP